MPTRRVPTLPLTAIIACVALSACTSVATQKEPPPLAHAAGDANQTLFNNDWLFAKEDPADAAAPTFDDHAWRKLALPHDWSIEGAFDQQWASSTAYLPAGIAWYRKHFVAPPSQDKIVTLRFDGVYKNSTVYLNGHAVGGRPYGYSSFECGLTPYLKSGDNVLAVRVDHSDFADSRWYTGSGIYRNVFLTVKNAVHVDASNTFVTTPAVTEQEASVSVQTTLANQGVAALKVTLQTSILDADGNEVATDESAPIAVEPASSPSADNTVKQFLTIPHPRRWSPDQPALYTIVTTLQAPRGKTIDTTRTPFGIRTIQFDPNTGFSLNGVNMKMKGVCLHEDAGALGAAIPQQVWERRLRILKDAGVNAIRTSHNPPAPEFLDLCDRLGFLVMGEAFDEWTRGKKKWVDKWNGKNFSTDGYHTLFDQWADRDIQDMVRRDRNHPSIVMWSIGNEIDYVNDAYPPNSPELPPIAARLIKDVKAVDTTRPVTAACAAIASNLFYPQLDIVGYNYQEKRYADDHAQHPQQVTFGSENYTSLDAWIAVRDNPYIFGQFVWTGIDYLGEARGWPVHGSGPGLLDTAGFPKPLYYFRKSLWSDEPMVKLEAGMGGRRFAGAPTRVTCYTNCDSVEFLQKDQSLGERPLSPATHTVMLPPFAADAPLTAIGKNGGKELARDTYFPPTPAKAISLAEYPTQFGAGDGENVVQIELTLTDDAGHRATNASDDVKVSVTSQASQVHLMVIESGDLASAEDPHASHRKAFHGRLILYVETHGRVTVTANVSGLPPASLDVGK